MRGPPILVRARFLLQPRHRPLQCLHVGQDELGLDHLDVGFGIDSTVDVSHIIVGEDAHHLADRIALTDVGEEFVAKTCALRGALFGERTRDYYGCHRRMHNLYRIKHLRELVQPRIRQRHHTLVRLDGRERVISRQHVVARQRVEER